MLTFLIVAVVLVCIIFWVVYKNVKLKERLKKSVKKPGIKLPYVPKLKDSPPPPRKKFSPAVKMAEPPSMQPSYMEGQRRLVKTKHGNVVPAYYSRGRYYAYGSNKYNDGSDLTHFVLYYMLWTSWMDSHRGDWNDVPNDAWNDCSGRTSESSSDGSSCSGNDRGSSHDSGSSYGGSDYGGSSYGGGSYGGGYDSGSSGGGCDSGGGGCGCG